MRVDLHAFAGHFPGNPALPGIAQLAIAAGDHPLRGVQRVKFREPVVPETDLEVELAAPEAGTAAFAIRTSAGGEPVTSGNLVLAAEPPRVELPAPPTAFAHPDVPPLEDMLPHRGPALFLTDVLHAGRPAWFAGRVPADNFVVSNGRVPTLATIELTCQAGAVAPELERAPDEPVRALRGLLAAVKRAEFAEPWFAVDTELVAAVTTSTRTNFVNVAAQIGARRDGTLRALATVELTILVLG